MTHENVELIPKVKLIGECVMCGKYILEKNGKPEVSYGVLRYVNPKENKEFNHLFCSDCCVLCTTVVRKYNKIMEQKKAGVAEWWKTDI